jgi:hypothetical protein
MSPNFEIHRYLPRNRGENPVPECWYQNSVDRVLVLDQHSHDHEYQIRRKGSTRSGERLVPDAMLSVLVLDAMLSVLVPDAMLSWYQMQC